VPHAHRITVVSIVINATLFILKLVAGMFAGSLAIMADATNSLLDTMYSIGVYWSVGESHKKADKGHPFGHGRAEPMVAFVISILMAIAAFEFLRSSTLNIFQGGAGTQSISMVVVAALLIAIVAKIFLSTECYHAGKKSRSPALLAVAADSRNDVLITMIALAGFIFSTVGFPLSDDFAALVISLFLFHEAYKIGKKNFDYLLGAAPLRSWNLRFVKQQHMCAAFVVFTRFVPIMWAAMSMQKSIFLSIHELRLLPAIRLRCQCSTMWST
jgi:cation diffusion facilitator family transporter